MKTQARRNFIIMSGALLSAAWVANLDARVFANEGRPRPNVIFIISDQMRGDALSCLGDPNASTPNLDRLASRGVLFERCFANNPVCAPSRMSMFSGRYPHQVDRLANIKGKTSGYLKFKNTLGDYFKQQGYTTAYVGKNHTYEPAELEQYDFVSHRDREAFRAYNRYVQPYWHCDTLWPREQCHPKQNTDDAIQFMTARADKGPFFLHISYFDPHPPYMAPAEFSNAYDAMEMEIPEYIDPGKLSKRLAEQQKALHYDRISDAELKATMKYYYASIEWGVDHQVGRLLDALDKQGLSDNTILVFTADHGDFMGEYRMVRKGMFLYDALMHVPMIWFGPGYLKEGITVPNLAQCLDIYPTLVDFTGGECSAKLEGRSLKPFLQGETIEEPDYAVAATAAYSDLPDSYFDHPEMPYDTSTDVPFHSRIEALTWKPEQRTAMARTQEWKLILNESRPAELYHMNGGTVERENVIDDPAHADVVKVLKAAIHKKWDAFSE